MCLSFSPVLCTGSLFSGDASSTHAGPLFENEARSVLNSLRSKIFPWATSVSAFVSRDDVSADAERRPRQFDLFAYSDGDSALPCLDDPGNGVAVLGPAPGLSDSLPAREKRRPLPATSAALLSGSPASASASSEETSPMDILPDRKYVVGEAYCGWRSDSEENKCHQLETELEVLSKRFCERTQQSEVVDITQLVGAAVLVFAAASRGSAKPKRRSAQLKSAAALVRKHAGPRMQRLMQAGRLVVVVLSPQQAPQSAAERESFSMLKLLAKSHARLEALMEAVLSVAALAPSASSAAASALPAAVHSVPDQSGVQVSRASLAHGGAAVSESRAGWRPTQCKNLRCPRRNLAARKCSKGCCASCCAGSPGTCMAHGN